MKHHNELHVGELDDEQKQWYALAICTVLIADGYLAPEEIQHLERALSFLPTPSQVDNLIESVKEQKLPELGRLGALPQDVAAKMMVELTQFTTSDYTLTSREMSCLFDIGQLLGFPKEYVQVLIRWANEGILWKRKIPHLIEFGLTVIESQKDTTTEGDAAGEEDTSADESEQEDTSEPPEGEA